MDIECKRMGESLKITPIRQTYIQMLVKQMYYLVSYCFNCKDMSYGYEYAE